MEGTSGHGAIAVLRTSPLGKEAGDVADYLSSQTRNGDQLLIISEDLLVFIPIAHSEAECELAALRVKSMLVNSLTPEELRATKVFTIPRAMAEGLAKGEQEAYRSMEVKKEVEPPLSTEELPSLFGPMQRSSRLAPCFGFYRGIPGDWEEGLKSLLPVNRLRIFSFEALGDIQSCLPPTLIFFRGAVDEALVQKLRSNRKLDYIVLILYEPDSDRASASLSCDFVIAGGDLDPETLFRAIFLSIERALWRDRLDSFKTGMAIRAQVHRLNQPLQVLLSRLELLALRNSNGEGLEEAFKSLSEKVVFVSEIASKIGRLAKELTRQKDHRLP